jgi:hypothetical protein
MVASFQLFLQTPILSDVMSRQGGVPSEGIPELIAAPRDTIPAASRFIETLHQYESILSTVLLLTPQTYS